MTLLNKYRYLIELRNMQMKVSNIIFSMLFVVFSKTLFAEKTIGVQLVDFVGLSYLDVNGLEGLQVDLGWWYDQKNLNIVGTGYKINFFPKKIMVGEVALDGFAGYGLKLTTSSNFATEIRTPIGVLYRVPELPLHISAGVAPGLGVYPGTWFSIGIMLAARFHL